MKGMRLVGAPYFALPASTILLSSTNTYFATAASEIKSAVQSLPSPYIPIASYATMAASSSTAVNDEQPNGQSQNGGQKPMLARQRAKQEAEAQGQSAPPKATYFPLSYKEGLSQWWAGLTPAVTEHRVLSFVPHLRQPPTHTHTGGNAPNSNDNAPAMAVDPSSKNEASPVRTSSLSDPYGPRQWHSQLVQLSGRNRFLNEFSVERVGEETRDNLVMLHGYGAGLGFFYKNFEALSRLPHWKLYALDMLGMGRSSRPNFRIHAKEKEEKVREAENWFIDALEEWRVKKGIEKMTLVGHSLGGYMAVCYALKYPGHLNKLILASPVGIPEDPYAVNEAMPEPGDSTLANEFAQSQDETAGATSDDTSLSPQQKATADENRRKRPMSKVFTALWDANISPFSLVRLSGPLGPRLVSGWTSRRFSHLPADESQALHDYSYSLFRQRGSGEYALAYVLAPGAFARSPLLRRIQGVGRQYLDVSHPTPKVDDSSASSSPSSRPRETGIPVVLMYGQNDWMDVNGGHAAAEKVREAKRKALSEATPAEKKADDGDVKVVVIKKAGHHVYLDNAEDFNRDMLEEMRDVERRRHAREQ